MRKEIDINKWERKEHFEFYSNIATPHYCVAFNIDVTNLLAFTRKNKISFYYSLIYLCTQSINEIDEFLLETIPQFSFFDETLMICDEIQCGYGRSGKFFAHQHLGVKPDMITVAKGIANGFPMGGLLISPKFEPVYGQLGTTFGGNHLACSAALAVIDVMEELE